MSVTSRSGIALLVCWMAWSWLTAQNTQAVRRVVEEILRLDGTTETVRDMRAFYEANLEFERSLQEMPETELDGELRWIEIVFVDALFEQDLFHGFAESFDPSHAQSVLDWLHAPLTRRLLAIEAEETDEDQPGKLHSFLNSPRGRRLIEARGERLRRYTKANQCAEIQLNMLSAEELARLSVINNSLPREERKSEEALRATIEEIRKRPRQGVFDGCWVPLVYTYRDVSDDDLMRFLSFFDTEAGQWYSEALANGIRQAWLSAGIRLGQNGFTWPQER